MSEGYSDPTVAVRLSVPNDTPEAPRRTLEDMFREANALSGPVGVAIKAREDMARARVGKPVAFQHRTRP